jgi:small GTP-binding protein
LTNLIQAKVCLLGAYAVGKTSLVRRFVEGRFEDRYLSTLGVKVSRKTITRPGYTLNMLLWDIAGKERFSQLEPNYIRGAVGALIVCDLTRPETIEQFPRLYQQVQNANASAEVVFVANKSDLADQRAISDEALGEMCTSLGGAWLLTSAKTGEGVEEAFQILADLLETRRNASRSRT